MSRRILKAISLALFAAAPCAVPAVAAPRSAEVVAVQATRVADLLVLDRGFDAGLRQGMVCRVTRGATEVAEILLVELRPTSSSALILNVTPKQAIRVGDVATVKVLKS
jgi:hypothetical protein